MRLSFIFLFFMILSLPLHAGEWKRQPNKDSIIELWTGWDWTKPGRGKYYTRWRDDFSVQTHENSWHQGNLPRIGIRVERLAPGYGSWYGRVEERFRLNEEFLTWWRYLKNTGVSEVNPIRCEARYCVTFIAGGKYSCGAFTHWIGQLNDRNDTDLIGGYYCASQSDTVTVETLDKIFSSLAILNDTGGYEKRATTVGIAEQPKKQEADDLSLRAEQGDADAQYTLGNNYKTGIGVQRDIIEARRWHLRAAENGHSEAQYEIGYNYEKGRFVGKNLDEAINWYRKAAAQENARAQYKIGLFYEKGWAVPKDLDEALNWYKKAASQGHALAGMALGRLQSAATVMEPAQVEDADVEAPDITKRLRKVKLLLDEGLITEAEAAEKRKAILDEF